MPLSRNHVNQAIITPTRQDMSRTSSAANRVVAIHGKTTPLTTPGQAPRFMQVIDAINACEKGGKPVAM